MMPSSSSVGQLVLYLSCLLLPSLVLSAQQPVQADSLTLSRDLSAFEGRYQYRDGIDLSMVNGGGRLVAIIGEAKYPLRRVAQDTFANGAGDRIPFLRDAAGRITAFQESGSTYRRLADSVAPALRALLVPRPPGSDGKSSRYRCAAPMAADDGIRVSPPGSGTLSCDAAAAVVHGILDGPYADVRSVLVHHRGRLLLEEYFYGYEPARPHQMRSLTKSVISLLAAAAIDRGLLHPDEPVLPRLGSGNVANADPRKTRISLSDMLSNQSGLACDDRDGASPGNEVKLYEADDWVKAFLDLPVLAEPGTVGRYCSLGILAAGRVVERAVGMPLPAFAQEVLFAPLGIPSSAWRWTFVLDKSQRNEFGQIHLRPRDMLKLGLLIQQRGAWQGRQVLSAERVDAAVAKLSRVDDSDYGLGIWHRWYNVSTAAGSTRVETIMLSGNGGQKVYIVPALDLVVAFTGGAFNAESPVNTIMAQVLLPALIRESGT